MKEGGSEREKENPRGLAVFAIKRISRIPEGEKRPRGEKDGYKTAKGGGRRSKELKRKGLHSTWSPSTKKGEFRKKKGYSSQKKKRR